MADTEGSKDKVTVGPFYDKRSSTNGIQIPKDPWWRIPLAYMTWWFWVVNLGAFLWPSHASICMGMTGVFVIEKFMGLSDP